MTANERMAKERMEALAGFADEHGREATDEEWNEILRRLADEHGRTLPLPGQPHVAEL